MTCDFLLKVGFASVLGSQDLVFIWLGVWLFNVFESIPTRGFRSLYCPWSGFLLGSVFLSVAQRGSVPLFRLGLIIINRRGFLCHNMVWLRGKFYSVLIKSHSLPVSGLYFHGYFNLSSKVMSKAPFSQNRPPSSSFNYALLRCFSFSKNSTFLIENLENI